MENLVHVEAGWEDSIELQPSCYHGASVEHALGYIYYFICFPVRGKINSIISALTILNLRDRFSSLILGYRAMRKSNISDKDKLCNDILFFLSRDISNLLIGKKIIIRRRDN